MTLNEGNQQLVADPLSFARSYQLEALEIALKQNTIVFFETGMGKTLIAVMLLRSYAHLLRKPSPSVAVFLVPTVVLVTQQSEVVASHTDLQVGTYYGEMGFDFWDGATWEQERHKHEVLVMTPQILLDALRRRYVRLDQIKVLIFDECHKARGKHEYACIMTEFYHCELASKSTQLPRVFGMTASPIKAKASSSAEAYWKQISELENLMHSKVFTCESGSVLTQYIPFSTPKLKLYNDEDKPCMSFKTLEEDLQKLAKKHISSLKGPNILPSVAVSVEKKINKLLSTFVFCLTELGIWSAIKAAEVYSRDGGKISIWGKMDVSGERVVKEFSSDAVKVLSTHIPTGSQWLVRIDQKSNMTANMRDNMTVGYLTPKITCLVETLLEYRELKELRCIVFVERIVTAIVICCLMNELLPEVTGWRTEYTAGNNSRFQSQSRKDQNAIVDEFRKGTVNIIVATSMLEEGLDVQSCNLVIRFDPSATICSFIQSRGRARMQNSDFVLMVKSDDHADIARVKNYLAGVDMMRQEVTSHADLPCKPLGKEMHGEPWYKVESTGAIVTLSSSVALLHFYCSRLPSDRYFKPYPICTIDKVLGRCTIQLPHGCPIRTITASGNKKSSKQLACLEACKELHRLGALTDNLVPDMVEEEAEPEESGNEPYLDEHDKYLPQELIGSDDSALFYFYLIELEPNFQYDVKPQSIMLVVHQMLDSDLENFDFDIEADRGKFAVHMKFVGSVRLSSKEIALCQKFQVKLLNLLLKRNLDKLHEVEQHRRSNDSVMFNYLLVPAVVSHRDISIDWKSIGSIFYDQNASSFDHTKCSSNGGNGRRIHTKDGLVCRSVLENSLVCTPHNGVLYCTKGTLNGVRGNTKFSPKDGDPITYKEYYRQRHGIDLQYEEESLLYGKHIFTVHNYLQRCRIPNKKEPSYSSCELPPELCSVIMSPISISTFYSFSFLPSVMHRIESLLTAANLKSVPMGHCMQNVVIPAIKVLEAITTKKCQEELHLESLEALGDSFLKYAATQQLFKTYQSRHEGLLSLRRERIICNAALSKLGCDRKIPGFIRNEPFDLKTWSIPGMDSANSIIEERRISASRKVYTGGSRHHIKRKTVADVVEALIGAFLSAAGEIAAMSFMVWLGIEIDFEPVPYTRTFVTNPEVHINIRHLESLLKYTFRDASLLVEALTHGSYMRPEIPGCYQRLEFLGDAVLDYLITVHLYHRYPGLSPGLLTDLRSASVNNDCYALSAIKAGLHQHILHLSPDLDRHISVTIDKSKELESVGTFGWESETTLPKVLGDVIESVAGAIFLDSGYDKETVFRSMKPLLEPMVTLETLRIHPKRELTQLCQKEKYVFNEPVICRENGEARATVEVEANGTVHRATRSAADRKLAERLACRDVLKSLKSTVA